MTVDGGNGNDMIRTGDRNDTILSGNGDDSVDAGRGDDTGYLGNGNDFFVWNPGEGSDTVDGGTGGQNVMQFNGSNASETMSLSANGAAAVFLRNVAGIRMDMTDIEIFNVQALGGADQVTIDNLEGTSIRQANVDVSDGHGSGDQQADVVTVMGTDGDDRLHVSAQAARSLSPAWAPRRESPAAKPGNQLLVTTGAGNDRVTVDPAVGTVIGLAVDPGSGQI